MECVNGLHCSHLRKLLCVYFPGHAGVKGNDRADRLAGKATLTSGLLLGRCEVLRSLRTTCGYKVKVVTPSIAWRREAWKEKAYVRRSSLKGRERAIVKQTNTGIVSKAKLEKFLAEKGGAHEL